MKWTSRLLVTLIVGVLGAARGADEGTKSYPAVGDESAKYQAEVIIQGLDNPCGLVLRPGSERDAPQELLFAESGAGRILGFAPEKSKETREVITGLTVQETAELKSQASAWSLGFVTPTKLAIFGGMQDGSNRIGVYVLPAENQPIAADKQDHQIVIADGEQPELKPVMPAMTFGETTAFFANGAVAAPGQVYRAGLAANRIEVAQPLLNTAESQQTNWPTGLCLSPSTKMQFLVAAFAGEMSDARDSRVVFLVPTSGKIALDLTPGLFDIIAVAYSPSGQLYAVDLAWADQRVGGVYRLDDVRHDGQPACRAVKIAEVARPTSLLFGDSSTLYVAAWGSAGDSKKGVVVKITGEF